MQDALEEPYFAPGTLPDLARAVHYIADHESPHDGTAVAARLHARALHQAGLPVLLSGLTGTMILNGARVPSALHIQDSIRAEVGHLRNTSAREYSPRIIHMVVGSANGLRRAIYPTSSHAVSAEMRPSLAARTVLLTVWERTRIPWDVAELMAHVGMNWVPCTQNAEMLRDHGVTNVEVVPHPFDPAAPVLRLIERPVPTRPAFYFVGRWEPRKAPVELLEAFLREFEPGEATLRLKSGSSLCLDTYPEPAQALAQCLELPEVRRKGWTPQNAAQGVTMLIGYTKPELVLREHFLSNIYCQVGHGEAWSLPAFDAKLAGNLMVHVPFGGTADYASSEDVTVPFELAPTHSGYGWGDACWASSTVVDVQKALRKAAEAVVGRQFARDPALNRFTLDAVGTLMRQRLAEKGLL